MLTMNTTTRKTNTKDWHPFVAIADKDIRLEPGEDLILCSKFVESICCQPCSDRISGHKEVLLGFNCLFVLQDDTARQEAVARCIVAFIAKPGRERDSIVMEWMRYTATTRKKVRACFFMPFLVNNNEDANEADANADAVNEADVNVDAIQPPHPLDGLKDCFVCSNSIALLLN